MFSGYVVSDRVKECPVGLQPQARARNMVKDTLINVKNTICDKIDEVQNFPINFLIQIFLPVQQIIDCWRMLGRRTC